MNRGDLNEPAYRDAIFSSHVRGGIRTKMIDNFQTRVVVRITPVKRIPSFNFTPDTSCLLFVSAPRCQQAASLHVVVSASALPGVSGACDVTFTARCSLPEMSLCSRESTVT